MRLAGVKTIEEANEFLDVYLPRHNKRFSKVALKEGDLHRPLPEGMDLQEILCLKDTRTINDGYLVRWKGWNFLIDDREENIEAAAKMGIHTILFTPQSDLESALRQLNLSF